MMHWPVSGRGVGVLLNEGERDALLNADGVGLSKLALQGVDLSDKSTPRSRASCSSVIGMKEPAQNKFSSR